MSLSIRDFQPINLWYVDVDGEKFDYCNDPKGIPKFLIDDSTGKKYLNDSTGTIRCKCFLLSLGTPVVHIPCGVVNIAYRVVKLLSCYHFWSSLVKKNPCNCSNRCLDFSNDGLRIIAQPFSIISLELASIYGIFNPYDGRKLYASIEKIQYGNPILAPCFQPDPKEHRLGGNINARDEY